MQEDTFSTTPGTGMYKFRNVSCNDTDYNTKTPLQTYFASFGTIASTIPLVVFMLLTTIYGELVKCKTRVVASLTAMIILFVVSTGFININTDTWQLEFFSLSMIIFAAVNAANAIFGVSCLAIVSKFPKPLLNCYITAQGIAGIFNSILQIISLACGTSTADSALIYFISGCGILTFTMVLYFCAKRLCYYNYFIQKPLKDSKKNIVSLAQVKDILKLIWSSVMIFVFSSTTTAITVPAITSLVVSEYAGQGQWADKYFVPVCTYLLSNLTDGIGRIITPYLKLLSAPMLVVISVVRMVLLVPLIMLCNARPRSYLPVVFPYDYQYILIIITFGLTRGYFFSSAFLSVPRLVPPEKVEVALSVLLTFVGITTGLTSPLSYLAIIIL